MDRIYFANKGHTRKHGCPDLWPVADKYFYRTPRDFFNEPGIIVYIDPKLINDLHFIARINFYDPSKITFRPSWNGEYEFFNGGCFMTAELRRGHITYNSSIEALPEHRLDLEPRSWNIREEALRLLKQSVEKFTTYFPDYGAREVV